MEPKWLVWAREIQATAQTVSPNQFIAGFGTPLANWLADVARFLTCGTEDKPFPWRTWSGTTGGLPAQ
jgi:hypothetical protein